MPTSVNAMYKTTREGRRVPSRDYREWQARALEHLTPYLWKDPIEGRIALWGVVCFNNKRRNDVQNRSKALCDVLEKAGIYNDDSQIDDIRMIRGPFVDDRDEVLGGEGYVSVRLWEIK